MTMRASESEAMEDAVSRLATSLVRVEAGSLAADITRGQLCIFPWKRG